MRIILIAMTLFVSSLSAKAEPIPQLQPLAPFIGTWQTISGSVDGSKNFEDVSKWEWAFGGRIVRITHSVNKGAYYGESLIGWDAQTNLIVYRYVNNAGFFTDGVITPTDEGAIEVHEQVRGATSGPTETLSGYAVTKGGTMKTWSKFKTNGEWGEVQHAKYKRAPDAEVIFKD